MKRSVGTSLAGLALCAVTNAQVTQCVSIAPNGGPSNRNSDEPAISADGRYVVFESEGTDLVPGDTNGKRDVFLRDRLNGTTERVSVDSSGVQSNGDCNGPEISPDARYVAFATDANNLVFGDTNSAADIFVRDRLTNTTERVSLATDGTQGDRFSSSPSLSADGRFVAFESSATTLVPGDTNGATDIFVRDRLLGTTERVSVDSVGNQANDACGEASLSNDGRYVAFWSNARNLSPNDLNLWSDVFVHDRQTGATELVSVGESGVPGDGHSYYVAISGDARFVVFTSFATNLVPFDTNDFPDAFVRDRQGAITERVSVGPGNVEGDQYSFSGSISADGRRVTFFSRATNLVSGDTNGVTDVFVRDRSNESTERVSLNSWQEQGDSDSEFGVISADGRSVAFSSSSTNLGAGGTWGLLQVFLRDRAAMDFINLCSPGNAGVIACPCSNAPSGPGRGCDNSTGGGGAALAAGGDPFLASDSLVLTTTGERLTAMSILLQGNGIVQQGLVYGQGVRCVGGTIIRRLFTKAASGGSISAPNFEAGDPPISAMSALKGDVIQPGQSRWYLVYYRDPVVLGGCPATSTFNATQTGQVTWIP